MSEGTPSTDQKPIPRATVRPRRFSALWAVPVLALAIVGFLVYQQVAANRGVMIRITFENAQGIEVGSELVHRGIRVGLVREVALSGDMSRAVVRAELAQSAGALASEGTAFWVVRPELSFQQISGLDTLVGPNYIAARPGPPGSPAATSFEGLDAAPALSESEGGAVRFTLSTDRLGTLAPGAPVLYREVRVGSVRSARLDTNAARVLIEIEVESRYAPLVRTGSRFWRSGGVGVDFGLFRGLSVEADSLESVISSSVSFATPESRSPERARAGRVFELADESKDSWLEWTPEIELGP